MRGFLAGLMMLTAAWLPAQGLEDLDILSRDLDWSILSSTNQETDVTQTNRVNVMDWPDNLPAPALEAMVPAKSNQVLEAILPGGLYLVAPDPASIPGAMSLIADCLQSHDLVVTGPLHVALHVDHKFSVAVRLQQKPEGSLPEGLGLSPLPDRKVAGCWTDTVTAERDQPGILSSVSRVRTAYATSPHTVILSDVFLFPEAGGQVFVALELR